MLLTWEWAARARACACSCAIGPPLCKRNARLAHATRALVQCKATPDGKSWRSGKAGNSGKHKAVAELTPWSASCAGACSLLKMAVTPNTGVAVVLGANRGIGLQVPLKLADLPSRAYRASPTAAEACQCNAHAGSRMQMRMHSSRVFLALVSVYTARAV